VAFPENNTIKIMLYEICEGTLRLTLPTGALTPWGRVGCRVPISKKRPVAKYLKTSPALITALYLLIVR
jgi:hypothetical protein